MYSEVNSPLQTSAVMSLPLALEPRQMVWQLSKTTNDALSANFNATEFRCRCNAQRCHTTLVHPRLVEVLQTLRDRLGKPLILTSGFRCVNYNRTVGGRARSFHTRGMAADIVCQTPETLKELAACAKELLAVGAIGQYAARSFIHIDVRPRKTGGQIETWSG